MFASDLLGFQLKLLNFMVHLCVCVLNEWVLRCATKYARDFSCWSEKQSETHGLAGFGGDESDNQDHRRSSTRWANTIDKKVKKLVTIIWFF